MHQEFISFVGAMTSPLKHSPPARKVVEIKFFNMRQKCFGGSCTRSSGRHWSDGMRSVREERKMGWAAGGLKVSKNVRKNNSNGPIETTFYGFHLEV